MAFILFQQHCCAGTAKQLWKTWIVVNIDTNHNKFVLISSGYETFKLSDKPYAQVCFSLITNWSYSMETPNLGQNWR